MGHELVPKRIADEGLDELVDAGDPVGVTDGAGDGMLVAAGGEFSLALTEAGTIVPWGNDEFAQTAVPVLDDGQTYTAISAAWRHSLAVTSAGEVKAWGWDEDGRLDVPTLPDGQTYTQVAAGGDHSLALTSTGEVKAWGRDWDMHYSTVRGILSSGLLIVVLIGR